MAQNGYGPAAGHIGRIPNYGKTQVNPMGTSEPPACIQNAMMTKDKKPFTYTPGGLDLSQIKTPSMARRLARQRSLEEQEQQYAQQNAGPQYRPQGGPPPPPPQMPAPPPPPPPIVIQVPDSKSPKPVPLGERPEIIIPDNPIGMLRKTNSPYHWEAEKAELQRMGTVPKFAEKVPSPLTVKMPPSSFTQQQPQSYSPQVPNNQRPNYSYNQNTPESPVHRPAAQYGNQMSTSPNLNGSTPTRDILQRQDSQFNKSPQPYAGQSPISNGSPYSPSPNNNWRQPERRDSPASNYSPQSQTNRGPFSPNPSQYSPNTPQYSPGTQNQSPPVNSVNTFHTLPRVGQRNQDYGNNVPYNNAIYNNTREDSPKVDTSNPTPWRTNTLNRNPREQDNLDAIYHNSKNVNQQPSYSPPWKTNEVSNNTTNIPAWVQDNKNAGNRTDSQQYSPRYVQDSNNNKVQESYTPPWKSQENERSGPTISSPPQNQQEPRYQTTMSIPVTPRKPVSQPDYNNTPPQREAVYVNQEPVYYCPESPNSIPAWVKTQKEKTKTPPPVWVQRPLERRSIPRELVTPPRETTQRAEPEWVKKSNDMQRAAREVISPPKYQQTAQPAWSTIPSENRKSLPRDNGPAPQPTQGRVIPIQMEMSRQETTEQGRQVDHHPQLRVIINMQQNPNVQGQNNQASLSQPTQRIMRVLSPQLVRLDDGQSQQELPSLNRNLQHSQDNQPRTRIIPIQIEGGSPGANKSFGGRY